MNALVGAVLISGTLLSCRHYLCSADFWNFCFKYMMADSRTSVFMPGTYCSGALLISGPLLSCLLSLISVLNPQLDSLYS